MGENVGLRGGKPALGAAGSAVEAAQKLGYDTRMPPPTTAPAVGCSIAFGIPSEFDRAGDLRRPVRLGPVPNLPVKTMTCGTCGGAAQLPGRGPVSAAPRGSAVKSTPGLRS